MGLRVISYKEPWSKPSPPGEEVLKLIRAWGLVTLRSKQQPAGVTIDVASITWVDMCVLQKILIETAKSGIPFC